MTQRTDRIDELLRQEIGAILARDVKDPRIGFVTITQVQTTPDLSHAVVWVSIIGEPADRTRTIRALGGVMHFVRRELGSRLRLRRIPDLHVRLDDTSTRGTRVLHLLEELEAGHEIPLDNEGAGPESLPTPVRGLPPIQDEPPLPGLEAALEAGAAPRPARRSSRGEGSRHGSDPRRWGGQHAPDPRSPRKKP